MDDAAEQLAAILREEQADVLTVYDSTAATATPTTSRCTGSGKRAAELAGTPRVFEATMNRDHLRRMVQAAAESGADRGRRGARCVDEESTFGRPESAITTTVDVQRLRRPPSERRCSCHASQISDDHFFAKMPDEAFAASFGQEWFIRHGVPEGYRDDDLLADLA